jgi:hypothetical protein
MKLFPSRRTGISLVQRTVLVRWIPGFRLVVRLILSWTTIVQTPIKRTQRLIWVSQQQCALGGKIHIAFELCPTTKDQLSMETDGT